MTDQSIKSIVLRVNLLLSSIGASLTLWAITRESSEAQSAILGGFSFFRLLVIFLILVFLSLVVWLFIRSFNQNFRETKVSKLIYKVYSGDKFLLVLIFFLLGCYFILFSSEHILGDYLSFRERLYPLILWGGTLGLQAFFTLFITRAYSRTSYRSYLEKFKGALILFVFLLFLVIFIGWSRVGLKADAVYWQNAGAPLLFFQVLIVWGIGTAHYIFLRQEINRPWYQVVVKTLTNSRIIFFLLWLLTCILWLQEPLTPSYNSLKPVPPNFQSYPFADALYYDSSAQQFLIGQAIPSHLWVKPFYTFFLSVLHLFVGQDYSLVIGLQVAVLAIIPSLVYILVSNLSNHSTGLIASLLFMIRELNNIALSNVIQVSNSKYLMSDVFGVLWMVLIILLMVFWLRNPSRHRIMPFLVGSFLGLFVFTRANAILLLPVILVIMAIVFIYKKRKRWFESVALITFGLAVSLAPWIWRNFQETGGLTLQDAPVIFSGQLANIYSLEPNTNFGEPLPSETENEYEIRIQRQIQEFVFEHPDEILRFTSAHYFRNLIFSYVYLPQSFQIESLRSQVKRLPFDSQWDGYLNAEGWFLLVANLLILSLGFKTVWDKVNILALIPFLMALGYNLSFSISRLSGWRFVMPSDWIVLIFYSAGLIKLTEFFLLSSKKDFKKEDPYSLQKKEEVPFSSAKLILYCVPFLLMGFGITSGHNLFSSSYANVQDAALLDDYRILSKKTAPLYSVTEVEEFLEQDNTVLAYGRALYPSYLSADKGEWNVLWPALAGKPYNRVTFHLIGSKNMGVVIGQDTAPLLFPGGTDVIVFGCIVEDSYVDYIQGVVVLVKTEPVQIFVKSGLPDDLSCDFP